MVGYVSDVSYTRGFHRELAPAWLDFAATLSGTTTPDCRDGFDWCEIGCGQGVTTVALAATHPHGRFVGIDLMPAHIDHAVRLAADAAAANVRFLTADVGSDEFDLPLFDYIVAHGVYSWVDGDTQAALRRFIDRHLRSGGLVYLSYNAMPGWFADAPFQRLILALASEQPGDSAARFSSAAELIRRIVTAGAPALTASPIAANLDDLGTRFPVAYLAHEYLGTSWRPLYVTEVREAMAGIGLAPAGSAVLVENFDSLVLRRAEREVLDEFDGSGAYEMVRDFLLHQRFRRDVYVRDGAALDDDARRERLFATRYSLARPPALVDYQAAIEGAGELTFDNDTARAIVAALASGPRRLREIAAGDVPRQDLLANLLALVCADMVYPVAAADAPVTALNRAICDRVDGREPIDFLALRCGTAIPADAALLRARRDGVAPHATRATADWLAYFALHA